MAFVVILFLNMVVGLHKFSYLSSLFGSSQYLVPVPKLILISKSFKSALSLWFLNLLIFLFIYFKLSLHFGEQ